MHIDPGVLVPILDEMVATEKPPPWDLISVDNDALEIPVKKGLVKKLSPFLHHAQPDDQLFQDLQRKLHDSQAYFVPLRVNVKLMYSNQELLRKAGIHKPPKTWEELHNLALGDRGRLAIQAHPGKAAAVTVFEWGKSMDKSMNISKEANPLPLDAQVAG